MTILELCIGITDVRLKDQCLKLYDTHCVNVLYSTIGRGTAKNEMLEYLGLENTEKSIHFAIITEGTKNSLRKEFMKQVHYGQVGNGILFSIPIGSVGGKTLMEYITQGQMTSDTDEIADCNYECIVAITNLGYTEAVMKAARKEGASGGTVMHVKGEHSKAEEKFFGVVLSDEKEVVLIVVMKSNKKAIMRSIMQEAGMNTPARTVVFSMPVSCVEGIPALE